MVLLGYLDLPAEISNLVIRLVGSKIDLLGDLQDSDLVSQVGQLYEVS